MEYPKWKYSREHAPRLVADPRDEAALGDEWADSPSSPANVTPAEEHESKT